MLDNVLRRVRLHLHLLIQFLLWCLWYALLSEVQHGLAPLHGLAQKPNLLVHSSEELEASQVAGGSEFVLVGHGTHELVRLSNARVHRNLEWQGCPCICLSGVARHRQPTGEEIDSIGLSGEIN